MNTIHDIVVFNVDKTVNLVVIGKLVVLVSHKLLIPRQWFLMTLAIISLSL